MSPRWRAASFPVLEHDADVEPQEQAQGRSGPLSRTFCTVTALP